MTVSNFVWYDLMTDDLEAAAAFYGDVVGWKTGDATQPGLDYRIFSMGDSMVGGLMPIPLEAKANGARPCWMGYVGVDDCDAYVKRVTDAGGAVHRAPSDIPNIGRFAVVGDPHDASFILFTPSGPGTPSDDDTVPGRIGWRELHAGDASTDFDFYAKLFGWTKADTHDMGPAGQYLIFATGTPQAGGMITKAPETPQPYWLYYFNVDAIDAASERVKTGGGSVWSGPHQVPGDLWVAMCDDPAGATFGLVAPKR